MCGSSAEFANLKANLIKKKESKWKTFQRKMKSINNSMTTQELIKLLTEAYHTKQEVSKSYIQNQKKWIF